VVFFQHALTMLLPSSRGSASIAIRSMGKIVALRMHEAGMIKSDPQKLIAEYTDWRFLNELKREMKT